MGYTKAVNDRRFSYYARLSAKDKAIYRKGDEIKEVRLPDRAALAPLVDALDESLKTGIRVRVAKATANLTDAVLRQLKAPPAHVKVREVRPDIHGGELHGLYTYGTKKDLPTIEVWMRTNSKEQVVKFKTFLRTLVHEIGHHLDLTILKLGDSFHNDGFFRRESSFVRQLTEGRNVPPKNVREKKESEALPIAKKATSAQLSLF